MRTSPLSSDDRAVVLTDRGRDLLEANRHERQERSWEPRQTFYAGLRKPRELTHDSKVYRAYLRAEERLREQGGRVDRVVLDYELKRDYQRFLHERNRGRKDCDGRPDREPEEIARWAREHDLPYDDGHVHFPDARIEYEDRDGRSRHEDIEIVTGHYRGAHAGAVARSGFSCYRAIGGMVGGCASTGRRGGSRHPRLCRGAARMNLPPPPDRWTIEHRERRAHQRDRVVRLHRAPSAVSGERAAPLWCLRRAPVPAASRASSTARRAPTSSRRSSSDDSRRRSRRASSIADGCSTSTTSRSGRPSASLTTDSGSRLPLAG